MSKGKKTKKSETIGEIAQRKAAVAAARSKAAAANADAMPDPDRVPLSEVMKEPAGKGKKKTSPPATESKPAKPAKTPKPAGEKRISGLDGAAQVLSTSGQPMRCKDMVDKMLADGLWKTDGKTPAATIYSAILREITVKGAESRFKKTDRGLFTINSK